MNLRRRVDLPILAWVIAFLVSACGSPPTIRDSTMLVKNVEKIHSLQFIYRNVELRRTSSYSYGNGATPADTGFSEFGGQLAKQAQSVFALRNVAVPVARVIDGKDAIPLEAVSGDAGGDSLPTLVVAPTSGVINANRHSTRASYVFSARLFDPRTRRMLWTATLDTSTWVGQDFVMKNVEKTTYDEDYASRLLKALIDQMAAEGII